MKQQIPNKWIVVIEDIVTGDKKFVGHKYYHHHKDIAKARICTPQQAGGIIGYTKGSAYEIGKHIYRVPVDCEVNI